MKYPPNYIIYKVFRRYLSPKQQEQFDLLFYKYKSIQDKYLYNGMLKFFDIEQLREKPLIWEDIWIYNYCKYEVTNKVHRNGLILKYEKEAFIKNDQEFWEFVKARNKKTT